MMTPDEVRTIAREAAREAVRELISDVLHSERLKLGVSSDSDDAVIALQRDFAFLRRQRLASEALGPMIKKAAIGALASGVLALLWVALRGNLADLARLSGP